MGPSRICIFFITLQLFSIATAQEMVKRVPQGFLGMRGKKYFEDSYEQLYKRKPQFFVGVKGKKSLSDILEYPEEYYKRAPTGFVGMRGKKDIPYSFTQSEEYVPKRDGSLIGQIDYSSSDDVDQNVPILEEILMTYLKNLEQFNTNTESSEIETGIPNEIAKRAASIHQFFGVRGKKSIDNKRPYDLTFRGKFIGVRGKKDLKNSGAHEIKFLLDNNPLLKRKSQMGFFGMRGKKWADESTPEELTESPPN